MEQFQIGPKLGRGVVGTSYSGQLADHTPVVVKVISRRFHEHAELLEQVLEDLRGWEGFRHLNVACTRSVGRHQDRHVVLFERAPGTTLAQWLGDHGPMDARKAVLVLRDLALVMAAVHQGEMPLGDIRSSKVYFNGHRARITDLGLARASCLAAGYGKHGMTFGHPAYLAPEVLQLRLAAPTPQTDVYAAGCLFYELLTGKPPFEGPAEQALRAHFEGELPPPPPAIVGSPKGRKLLVHMLAKDPGKRFHDGQALVDALYELVGQAPPQQELAAMNSGIWRAQAARPDLRGRADWSPERVFNAQPIGPDLSGEGAVSGRFPRQSVQPPAAAPAAAASGGEGGEGGGEGDDDVPLDGVRVDKKLGRGPVGTTYEGKLAHYTGDVVVKVLSSKFSKHKKLYRKVIDGIERAVGLGGPHVVPIFRLMKVSDRDLIVMERIRGRRTLRKLLKRKGAVSADEALALIQGVAEGLVAGQRRELAHGDVRAEKVYLDDQGRARLADFGLVEASCLGAGYGELGIRIGHPTYLAPEIVQESLQEPTFLSDVYALGLLLYELVSGRPPFEGKSPKKTLVMHLEEALPPPPRRVKLPAPVGDLIMKLASKEPDRRSKGPQRLLDDIARCRKQTRLAESGELGIEEFDPTDATAEGALWASEERAVAKLSDDTWSRDKIDEAPDVGPSEWEPGAELYQSEELQTPPGLFPPPDGS